MKGAILEKGEKSYTHLLSLFSALGNIQNEYNWLVTNCDIYYYSKLTKKLISGKYCWLSGEELTEIVEDYDLQWVWVVLSGFDKDIRLKEILEYPLPYVDGYTGFWKNPVSIQHPLASIEIAAFDSSGTIIISKEDAITTDFIKAFPLSEDLYGYNKEHSIYFL